MKRMKRMKRNIGHGMQLSVVADADVPVIDAVIELLERYLGFCRKYRDAPGWRNDGGNGVGRESGRRRVYEVFVGPSNCTWETSPSYPERIEALVPVLALARQVKDTGGGLEELGELLKRRRQGLDAKTFSAVMKDKAKKGGLS